MGKDLLAWIAKGKAEESEDSEMPMRKPNLGEDKIEALAEECGVENPAALVKLIKAVVKHCGGEGEGKSDVKAALEAE
jgi:hypothetical protein